MEQFCDQNYPKRYPYYFREEMNNGFCMNPNGMMTGPGISGLAGSAQPLDSQYRPENRREKSNKRAKASSMQQSYEEKYEAQRQKTSFKHEEGKFISVRF